MLSFAVTGRLAQVVTPHAPRLPGRRYVYLGAGFRLRLPPHLPCGSAVAFGWESTSPPLPEDSHLLATVHDGRTGRNRPHGRPPAQIPARGTTALGSYLGSSVGSVLGVTLSTAWALEPSAARRRSTNWVQEAVLPPPLSRLPTRRHGATHLTSLARLSVRGVFCRPCPLGLPPFLHRLRFRSGMRGSPHAALFDGFAGTTRQYDFPRRASRTCGLSLLRAARPSISRTGDRGISRVK